MRQIFIRTFFFNKNGGEEEPCRECLCVLEKSKFSYELNSLAIIFLCVRARACALMKFDIHIFVVVVYYMYRSW